MEPSKETCTAYTFQEKTKWKESTEMSQTTITLLFLVFTIISFILEKIPLGLTASICAIGLTPYRSCGCNNNIFTVCKQ